MRLSRCLLPTLALLVLFLGVVAAEGNSTTDDDSDSSESEESEVWWYSPVYYTRLETPIVVGLVLISLMWEFIMDVLGESIEGTGNGIAIDHNIRMIALCVL